MQPRGAPLFRRGLRELLPVDVLRAHGVGGEERLRPPRRAVPRPGRSRHLVGDQWRQSGGLPGRFPCKCDYCMAGKLQPRNVRSVGVQRRNETQFDGLALSDGPDPRSISKGGLDNWARREMMMGMGGGAGGMDMAAMQMMAMMGGGGSAGRMPGGMGGAEGAPPGCPTS